MAKFITRTMTETKVKAKVYDKAYGLIRENEYSLRGDFKGNDAISKVLKPIIESENGILIDIVSKVVEDSLYRATVDDFMSIATKVQKGDN